MSNADVLLAMDHSELVHNLRERVKELTLLHQTARLLGDDTRPVADALRAVAEILPPAWQYPEITTARITVDDLHLASPGFFPTQWMQTTSFTTSAGQRGTVEVAYMAERPGAYEGPFLLEERHLIDSVAQMLSGALGRRWAWDEANRVNAELERRVASRTAELEATTRALEVFAYSVAHDLKAPLRGVDGYSRLLLEDYAPKLDAEGRTFLFNIRNSAQRMSQLIDDLLAYSLLDRRPFTTGRVSVPSLVAAIVAERRPDLERDGIAVTQTFGCDAVTGDAEALTQALRNYVDNAIKFTRGVADPRIEIAAYAAGGCCRIGVRDNGIGFDMKYHDRIFEIFQRLHREEDHPGTGIGLAIVRKAMERLGGRAWAESAPGSGATFYIEIPQHSERVR